MLKVFDPSPLIYEGGNMGRVLTLAQPRVCISASLASVPMPKTTQLFRHGTFAN